MTLFQARKESQQLASFSLVEVVIAIGICALALVSIVGLFPAGLSTLRSSKNSTAEGQLLQYVAATSSLSSYTNVTQVNTVYFGQDGRFLTNASDPNVRFRVLTQPVATSLPGSTTFSTNDAVCLQVTIFQQAGPNGPSLASNVYAIQVTNSGK